MASATSLGCAKLPNAPVPNDTAPVTAGQGALEASAYNASNGNPPEFAGKASQTLAQAANAIHSVASASTTPALVSPSAIFLLSSCESPEIRDCSKSESTFARLDTSTPLEGALARVATM